MRATLTGDERRCNGPVELDVEWKLFGSSNDSVLYTRTNTVVYHALMERPADLVNGALELAAALHVDVAGRLVEVVQATNPEDVRIIEMGQGQKQSRILAWTFRA